jgi:hypothetical protein
MIQFSVGLVATLLIGYFLIEGIATFIKKVAEGVRGVFKKGGRN